MAKKSILILFLVFGLPGFFWAQTDDRVLFTVDGQPVRVDEFTYIYSKTNGDRADFSRASLEEYLELYTKFKLKVQKAKELRLDTIPELRKELERYRKQLSDSYLVNKQVTEKLVQEAYERVQQDVDLRHILFQVEADASKEEEEAALERAQAAYRAISSGSQSFESVAKTQSDDSSTKDKGGHIGFQTALFPPGFYPLETAAYELPVGKVSRPIRTPAGFHLLQVDERRPARGEVEVAHILIRHKKDAPDLAKKRIDSLYQALEEGANFETLARQHSEDRRTASQGGLLGFFGINRYQASFENAAFGLDEDGAYSQPVETEAGWHIIKRISRRGIQPLPVMKSRLETQVRRDPRFQEATDAMVAAIIRDAGLREYPAVLDEFKGMVNDTLLTFRWKAPETPADKILFELGDRQVSLGAFVNYLVRNTRDRIRMKGQMEVDEAVDEFYQRFLQQEAMSYEESQLEKKYPEFKNLMREYNEGILLFEATKMLVWDKAAQDSTGLEKYFRAHRDQYQWNQRAELTEYRLADDARDQMPRLLKYAADHSPEEVLEAFNTGEKPILIMDQQIVEKGKGRMPKNLNWIPGAMTPPERAPQSRKQRFFKVESVMEARPKSLDEARGYVIADYQDYLEARWVDQLREEYPVKINRDVLESLIQN